MTLESSHRDPRGRREYHLLLVCNLVLLVAAVFGAHALLGTDLLATRLGRSGPLGLLLLVGGALWAWAEILILPLVDARRAFSRPIPREP